MRLYSILLILAGFILLITDGARILGIFPLPAPSHYILGDKLMRELASKGHNITYMSAFERKTAPVDNLKDIVVSNKVDTMDEFRNKHVLMPKTNNILTSFPQMLTICARIAEEILNHPNTQELLQSNEQFDLIIMETVMNEAHLGFGYHFKAPTIILSTIGLNIWVNEYTMNPFNPAYEPDILTDFPSIMGFVDRLKNTVISTMIYAFIKMNHYPSQNELLHKHFPNAPHVEELMHNNISLVLLNSHPSYGMAQPSTPNMIEIGGYHIDEPKQLPKDLQKYLDGAKSGVILFSMGSNLKSTMLPQEFREKVMSVFAKLPYQILWKFEDDHLEGKPDNVKINKWLPQNDILAHPNIKLFITHGGLLSTTEAVYHGVPIVGIPVFGDQQGNMVNAVRIGIGKSVQFINLDADQLYETILEVLNNKSYRMNIRRRSTLLRDQPLRPIDNAIFWIEYTLRNGYSDHLKSSAIHLKWYQIMLLDVIATLVIGIAAAIVLPYLLIKKLCCGRKQKKKTFPQELKKKN